MWILYIIRCKDNSLYTGITSDLKKRLTQHRKNKGAKYTRGRGPFKLLLTEKYKTRSDAAKREYQIKQLSRTQKFHQILLGISKRKNRT